MHLALSDKHAAAPAAAATHTVACPQLGALCPASNFVLEDNTLTLLLLLLLPATHSAACLPACSWMRCAPPATLCLRTM